LLKNNKEEKASLLACHLMVMMQEYLMNLKFFTNVHSALVDPKNFSQESFVTKKEDVCIIPPNSFALASTVEYFKYQEMFWLFA
jgi:deoxycytidine triphosphate deaminase